MWGAIHQFKIGLIVENERYFRTLERRPNLLKSTGLAVGGGTTVTNYNVTASLAPFSRQRALGNTWGSTARTSSGRSRNLDHAGIARREREHHRKRLRAASIRRAIPTRPGRDPGLDPASQAPGHVRDVRRVRRPGRIEGRRRGLSSGIDMADGAFYAQNSLWQRYRQLGNINIDNLNLSHASPSVGIRGTTARPSSRSPPGGSTTRSSSAS